MQFVYCLTQKVFVVLESSFKKCCWGAVRWGRGWGGGGGRNTLFNKVHIFMYAMINDVSMYTCAKRLEVTITL